MYLNRTNKIIVSTSEKEYINRETFKVIIKYLKVSNSKGYDGMSNNILKFTNLEVVQHKIMVLINAILNTGYTPKTLNRSIIIPKMKDKNRKDFDKNNFRPISVSNVFAQILKKFILLKCNTLFITSKLKFGFKQQMFTLHPLFLLKEVMHKHIV